jgi:hypothetical protein
MQFNAEQREKLKKFFADPDWAIVQKAIGDEIVRLEMLKEIDATTPAEDVKAQVIGHKRARSILLDFFKTCDIISRDDSDPDALAEERSFR